MHEFGLAESTLTLALEQAGKQGAERIHGLNMRIGALTGVVEEAFNFAFDALSAGTIAAGAQLKIDHVPVLCYCPRCGREFETRDWSYLCPSCGEASTDVRRGREFDLVSMEVS